MLNDKDLEMMRRELHNDYLAEEAKEKASLTGGRSLYRVLSGPKIVAFISSYNADRVVGRYRANGGEAEVTNVERVSFGYPADACQIFA